MPMGSRISITLVTSLILLAGVVFAQSTGSIQGTVTDMTGAVLPNASVTVTNQQTGESHPLKTDSAGLYSVPGLTPGNYKVEVQTRGMQTTVANDLVVSVGITTTQNFTLKIAGTSTTVEIQATAAILESASVSVGTVVNQKTVQEIPFNGRHFVDLALLIPGTVTPPANGFLTAPLRGQGSFSFNSAGAREDSVNFMINGINLSDPNQNQITFQPTINTVGEFKIDNQTFSAEYGRNSGSIVNIATRSGENTWHGEAYEYLRNNYLDARNFSNPTKVRVQALEQPNPEVAVHPQPVRRRWRRRHQERQDVPISELRSNCASASRCRLSSTTLTPAQRAQAASSSDPIVQACCR